MQTCRPSTPKLASASGGISKVCVKCWENSASHGLRGNLTGLTWGNLSSHLRVLEEAGYINIDKKSIAKKTKTMIQLTEKGRSSFKEYKNKIQKVFGELPD